MKKKITSVWLPRRKKASARWCDGDARESWAAAVGGEATERARAGEGL